MTSASVRIDPGTVVGPYAVERVLAQDAMSVMYLARPDDAPSSRVVLKMLAPDDAPTPIRARVQREARALASVDHPGVVRVYAAGEHEGAAWIAMDYVRGTDLRSVLAEGGALLPETALQYTIEATEALAAAHAAGVLHRDLKPSNMLITPEGRIVLVDFGIAKRRSDARDADVIAAREVVAAAAYLSPEQIEYGLADERSDIWSLGCVLYEMLVAAPPFGPGGSSTMTAILHIEPDFPPSIPAALVQVIVACLRKSSLTRVSSAPELLSMLRDAQTEVRSKRPSAQALVAPVRSSSSMRRSSVAPSGRHSSAVRIAITHGRVKGAAIRAAVEWVAEAYGEECIARFFDLASPDLVNMLRKEDPALGIIPSGWYQTSLVGELLDAIERAAAPTDPVIFTQKMADAIARDNVGGVYRALFRLVASPPLLEANAQRVWRTYVDEGTLSVTLTGPGSFIARVRGWSHHDPVVCLMIRPMIESLLRAVGYTALIVERTQCVGFGDSHCIFEGNWLP